jgi:hypothetical protein
MSKLETKIICLLKKNVVSTTRELLVKIGVEEEQLNTRATFNSKQSKINETLQKMQRRHLVANTSINNIGAWRLTNEGEIAKRMIYIKWFLKWMVFTMLLFGSVWMVTQMKSEAVAKAQEAEELPALYAQNAEKMEGGMEDKVNALPGLCQDYEALFTDMLYADGDIVTGTDDKVLQAHKVILSSKFLSLIFFQFSPNNHHYICFSQAAPQFSRRCWNETLESTKYRIVIEKFDHTTVQELLRYIYCCKVENMKNVALNLLAAADEYKMFELKIMCEKALQQKMTVKNVAKVLKTASLHDCQALKENAVAFIAR